MSFGRQPEMLLTKVPRWYFIEDRWQFASLECRGRLLTALLFSDVVFGHFTYFVHKEASGPL